MFNNIVVCIVIFALHFSLIGCASTGTKTVQAEPEESLEKPQLKISEFTLGAGDTLDISVWRNDDLRTSTKINPSGRFMFPLIGDVQAAGKDLSAVRDDMKVRLSKYLVDPQVSISVSAIWSRRVLVMGEVNAPGAFILDRDLTVLDAVATAGGWNRDAKPSNVILLRKVNGKVEARSYDMSGTVDGRGVPENVLLQANDIVYVPVKTIANMSRFMTYISNILSPIVLAEAGIVLWPQMINALNGKSSQNNAIIAH